MKTNLTREAEMKLIETEAGREILLAKVDDQLSKMAFAIRRKENGGDDLLQVARMGFDQALQHFDSSKSECSPSDFAYFRARYAIYDELSKNNGLNGRDRRLYICKDLESLSDEEYVKYISLHNFANPISLNSCDEDGNELMDMLESQEASPEEKLLKDSLEKDYQDALSTLTPKERRALEANCKLNKDNPETLTKLGEEFGVSRQAMKKAADSAFKKVTAYMSDWVDYFNR